MLGFYEINFLGYKVDKDGIKVDEERIKPILDRKSPKDAKEIQRFLGVKGYYQNF